jgi:hypothetical protein
MSIVKHYDAQGLVRTVKAETGPDEVFEHVRKIFEDLDKKQAA